jgi:hypothetical protein
MHPSVIDKLSPMVDHSWPANALAYHTSFAESQQTLLEFTPMVYPPDCDGTKLAIAVSYTWDEGEAKTTE